MRVRFLGFDHTDHYRSSLPGCDGVPWSAREVRDVPNETADYLIGSFGGHFVKEGGRPRKVAISAPPRTAAISSPPDRDLPVLSDALDQSVAALKTALASGVLDSELPDLLAAEQAGKTRRSAVNAIKARQTILRG
jgi:hypothetical protein